MDPNMFHLNYILAALQLYYSNSTLSTFLNLSQLNLAKTMQCNSLSAAGAKDNLRPTFGGRRSAADVRRPTSSARLSLFKIFSISSIVSLDLLLYFLSRSSVRCYLHLRWYYNIWPTSHLVQEMTKMGCYGEEDRLCRGLVVVFSVP